MRSSSLKKASLKIIKMSEMSDITKDLAKQCLEEKWYDIKKDPTSSNWSADCAFCRDSVKNNPLIKFSAINCRNCRIGGLYICRNIAFACDQQDVDLIINALEELAINGEQSPEMHNKLRVIYFERKEMYLKTKKLSKFIIK